MVPSNRATWILNSLLILSFTINVVLSQVSNSLDIPSVGGFSGVATFDGPTPSEVPTLAVDQGAGTASITSTPITGGISSAATTSATTGIPSSTSLAPSNRAFVAATGILGSFLLLLVLFNIVYFYRRFRRTKEVTEKRKGEQALTAAPYVKRPVSSTLLNSQAHGKDTETIVSERTQITALSTLPPSYRSAPPLPTMPNQSREMPV